VVARTPQSDIYSWWRPEPPACLAKLYAQLSRAIGFVPMAFWGEWGLPLPKRVPTMVSGQWSVGTVRSDRLSSLHRRRV
jgi:hypothetical protein